MPGSNMPFSPPKLSKLGAGLASDFFFLKKRNKLTNVNS
jgi:hypothetical protein